MMKPKLRDYFSLFFDMLIKRPAKEVTKKVRYQVELGGENGYEVNGIGDYWGRYASIKKIVELAHLVKTKNDWFNFYFPAKKYDNKFSHQIGIHCVQEHGYIEIEFCECSSQCGSFFKTIPLENLEVEISKLNEIEISPEANGYLYKEW